MAGKRDAIRWSGAIDPLQAEDFIRKGRRENGPLVIKRKGSRWELKFVFGSSDRWTAWIDHAVPERPL